MTAVVAPEQQLTRRRLRELRQSEDGVVASAVPRRDAQQTETLPLPTRRTIRGMQAPRPKRSPSTNAPRAAILSTLGIATIAAPLTGFVTPEQSAQAIGVQIEVRASLAESISALAAQGALEGTLPSAAALTANPSAAAIALDLSARNQSRTATVCSPVEGASGVREASVERIAPIFEPMAAGTYRNSSFFGSRWGYLHTGTDFAAALDTPLYAVTDGEVVLHSVDGEEGRSGNLVVIHSVIDGTDVWFWYGHMYDDGVYVEEGDTVRAGQVIGGVGNKGYSTGPHLHFEVHVGEWDNVVDPLVWLNDAGAVYPGTC